MSPSPIRLCLKKKKEFFKNETKPNFGGSESRLRISNGIAFLKRVRRFLIKMNVHLIRNH